MNYDNPKYSNMYIQFTNSLASNPFVAFRTIAVFHTLRKLLGTYEQKTPRTFDINPNILPRTYKTKWTYKSNQEALRDIAIQWQSDLEKLDYSYNDIALWNDFFYEMGKKYGLIREFKENGIL